MKLKELLELITVDRVKAVFMIAGRLALLPAITGYSAYAYQESIINKEKTYSSHVEQQVTDLARVMVHKPEKVIHKSINESLVIQKATQKCRELIQEHVRKYH